MKLPEFVAEASLYKTSTHYRAASFGSYRYGVYPAGTVWSWQRPFAIRARTELTCEPGSEAVCEAWCQHAGGGMSSNPDGSVTCTVYS